MELSVLPALDGDCLILSYGQPRRHSVIDGGRAGTYRELASRLRHIADAGERLELLVLTHFDADHVEGLLRLAQAESLPIEPDEVWFNGFDQLSNLQTLGPRQADDLSTAISKRKWPLNRHFAGNAVCLDADGCLPVKTLDSGLELTILSPDLSRLRKLRAEWENWRNLRKPEDRPEPEPTDSDLQSMGPEEVPVNVDVIELAATTEEIDTDTANGSSIAFIARYGSKRVLLAADAHPDLLVQSLRQLTTPSQSRVVIDLAKVSHHGSRKNTTRELVRLLDCKRFVISTNGQRHGHPDPEAVARLLVDSVSGKRILYFNYRQRWAELWASPELEAEYDYECKFPTYFGSGLRIDV